MLSNVLILLVLITLSAFFSASETALFSLTELEKKRLSAEHPRRGMVVGALLKEPRRTLLTILIGNVVVNTFASVLVTLIALEHLGARWLSVVTVLFALVLVWFGEIIPKFIAVRHNEGWAGLVAGPLRLVSVILWPIRKTIRLITDVIMNLITHTRERERETISDDELETLVGIGGEEGVVDKDETRMIRRLLELGDRQVKEIMTPRTELIGFDLDDDTHLLVETIRKNHVSYIPVYRKTADHIIGMVAAEEFMLSDRLHVKTFIRKVHFVPETKRIDELFLEFQKDRRDVAIAVDEHGGTAGIVTDEDILEEIFGEIYDEFESPKMLIQNISGNECIVDGKISLHDFNEHFKSSLSSDSEETLAGFLMERFGHIPARLEEMNFKSWKFTVLAVRHNHIEQVKVTML